MRIDRFMTKINLIFPYSIITIDQETQIDDINLLSNRRYWVNMCY